LGREPLVIRRPRAVAADPAHETLFVARASLKRALALRRDAEHNVDQLRALVARLEEGIPSPGAASAP
jgi:hypothetical protein